MKKITLLIFFLLIPSPLLLASTDYYQFTYPAQQQRFHALTTELRCLVCQNQNLAESNAALAVDLRSQIYKQILDKKSDNEIIDYLVARYGNFILYRPPFNILTLTLWLGPFLLLLGGVTYLFYYIRNK